MRFAVAIVLSLAFYFGEIACYCQEACPTRLRPPHIKATSSELAHAALLSTPPEKRTHLIFDDVELILKCGSEQDAEELFAALRNTRVQINGATVVDTGQSVIRVSRDDDGFKPNFEVFRFIFDTPLNAVPHSGDKILISGTYSSYTRDPFQINITHSSFALLPSPAH